MSEYIILHNPRCTKSRETLKLLNDNNINPKIIEYLKGSLNLKELNVLKLLS